MKKKVYKPKFYNHRFMGRIAQINDTEAYLETPNGKFVRFDIKEAITPIAEGDIVAFVGAQHSAKEVGVPMLGVWKDGVYHKFESDFLKFSVFDVEEVNVMKRVIQRTMITQRKCYVVYHRDDFTCKCCNKRAEYAMLTSNGNELTSWKFYTDEFVPMTIDHKWPQAKGGTNEISNLQTMCLTCNQDKADNVEVVEGER